METDITDINIRNDSRLEMFEMQLHLNDSNQFGEK